MSSFYVGRNIPVLKNLLQFVSFFSFPSSITNPVHNSREKTKALTLTLLANAGSGHVVTLSTSASVAKVSKRIRPRGKGAPSSRSFRAVDPFMSSFPHACLPAMLRSFSAGILWCSVLYKRARSLTFFVWLLANPSDARLSFSAPTNMHLFFSHTVFSFSSLSRRPAQ